MVPHIRNTLAVPIIKTRLPLRIPGITPISRYLMVEYHNNDRGLLPCSIIHTGQPPPTTRFLVPHQSTFRYMTSLEPCPLRLDDQRIRRAAACLAAVHRPSGQTLMSACAATLASPSQIANIIAGTAEMCFVVLAPAKAYRFPTLVTWTLYALTMAAMKSSLRGLKAFQLQSYLTSRNHMRRCTKGPYSPQVRASDIASMQVYSRCTMNKVHPIIRMFSTSMRKDDQSLTNGTPVH
ncbi:hypothetical protein IQ06DRAFT_80590 [Phaeosphaeriaceae sp. SRC1lsM3a]|nr:hypothetical protein IQ06DRAFT_80590 [Stagonospora sp. SRC1lsM3a]